MEVTDDEEAIKDVERIESCKILEVTEYEGEIQDVSTYFRTRKYRYCKRLISGSCNHHLGYYI